MSDGLTGGSAIEKGTALEREEGRRKEGERGG